MASISGITSCSNNIYSRPQSWSKRAMQRVINLFGGKEETLTIDSTRARSAIKWIGREISSPENRLILGATALLSQPFIDLHNKTINDETKKYAVARTIAKIVVGTTTGVIIRKGCIKFIDAFTKLPGTVPPDAKFKNLRQLLLPAVDKIDMTMLKQHKNALGTLFALAVMVFTNFLVDAPLTAKGTNFLMKHFGGKKNEQK